MKLQKWNWVSLPVITLPFWLPTYSLARQQIVVGSLATGYEYTERDYDETVDEAGQPVVIVEDQHTGDQREYYVAPRLTLTSIGEADRVELTYSPRLNYDDLYSETDVDHDFRLRGERFVTKDWRFSLENSFFLGDDPERESELRTGTITAAEEAPSAEGEVVGSTTTGENTDLANQLGRRRFWRNDLNLVSEYEYQEDSIFGVGYGFGMLRNEEDVLGGYDEYDRHDAMLRGSYRFNRQWLAQAEGHYVVGDFEETDSAFAAAAGTEEISDDLTGYQLMTRVNYDLDPHEVLFSTYSGERTEYDDTRLSDTWIHELALGWDHDFSERLSMTVSAGPTFAKRDGSSWDNDYNAHLGLDYDLVHSTLRLYGEKGYEQDDFDGSRDGLADYWRYGAEFTHHFTPTVSTTLFARYEENQRFDSRLTTATGDTLPLVEEVEYEEQEYEAGVRFSYGFMRYYAVEGGYRYTKQEADLITEDDYDEHNAFIQLVVSTELMRW